MFSCAPVLRKDLMIEGIFDAQLSEIKQNPTINKGKLFVLGGIIVKTTVTKEGSLIEAIHVPVNSRGYLKSDGSSNGRFLAIYHKELLDPLLYSERREITLAGEFIEIRKNKIGEMDYSFPVFEIKDIHLWEEIEKRDYYYGPPYYYPRYYRHYPYYYPWWY
jgi:outer membrane lipoprotein